MGFIRKQEENLACRLLKWQYQRLNYPLPGNRELRAQAARIVDDAHQIASEKGHNVYAIIKDSIRDLKKK